MKKTISIITIIILFAIIAGCGTVKTEVARKVVDCRYTPPRSEVTTTYEHKYSWYKGDFILVPNVHTVHKPEKYEFLYSISYDDGSTAEVWQEVEKSEYMSFMGGAE